MVAGACWLLLAVLTGCDVSETTTIGATGVQTGPNEFSVPASGLIKAQNCVMSGQNVVTSRRGQTPVAYTHAGGTELEGYIFNGAVAVLATDYTLYRDTGSAFSSLGTVTPADASLLRLKSAIMRNQMIFASSLGARSMDASFATLGGLRQAGVEVGTARCTPTVLSTNGGFLSTSSSVAYRIVFGMQTANGDKILGPPSGRFLATNSNAANTYNVSLTFSTIIQGASAGPSFWQLYRSPIVSSSVTPSDEMFLVAEGWFTSTEYAAGEVTFVDSTPGGSIGYPLYTNPSSGEGIEQGNRRPPFAKDVAAWGDTMWYANTRQPQAAVLQLLGVGAGVDGKTGLRLGDQIQFVGGGAIATTYTAWGTNDTASKRFAITSSGAPSENIRASAISLAAAIQFDAGIRPEYLSGESDSPGILLFSQDFVTRSAFRINLTTYRFPVAIGGLDRAANVTTVTTTGDHGLAVGDTVYIAPSSTPDANFPLGTFAVATVPTATTFTYAQVLGNAISTTAYTSRRITPVPQYAWNAPPSLARVAVGGLSRTSTTVTATTQVPHGAAAGDYVNVLADSEVDANFAEGVKLIVTVPSATTFTYTEAGSATTSTTVYGAVGQVLSDADVKYNGLYYSKVAQPEAVPFPNYMEIGPVGNVIKRIVPLDNGLTVWTSGGLYLVTGVGPYRAELVDPTVQIVAPDTAQSVDGWVYALTGKGVVRTNGTSVEVVSQPIESELDTYLATAMLSTTAVAAFGVSKETDRQYLLGMPANSLTSTAPYNAARFYVYSTRYGGWTTWETPRYWGRVSPSTDVLCSGLLSSNTYATENSTRLRSDFADGTITLTGVSFNTTTLLLTCASTASLSVGDMVLNGATLGASTTGATVVSIDSGTTATLSGSIGSPAATVIAYLSFPVELEWRAVVAPSPADWKHWRSLHLHWRNKSFYKGTAGFRTNWNETQTEESYPLITSPYTWASSNEQLVGIPTMPKQSIIPVPTNSTRAAYLRVAWEIREAFALWGINGATLVYEGGSDRGPR